MIQYSSYARVKKQKYFYSVKVNNTRTQTDNFGKPQRYINHREFDLMALML